MDLRCSEVEVKVLDMENSQVKYKYLKIALKYSTKVNVLSYFTSLLRGLYVFPLYSVDVLFPLLFTVL